MKLILYTLFFLEFLLAMLVASAFPFIPEAQFLFAFVLWLCLSNWTSQIFERNSYV